eukprot:998663-Rhodomonas_salina.2
MFGQRTKERRIPSPWRNAKGYGSEGGTQKKRENRGGIHADSGRPTGTSSAGGATRAPDPRLSCCDALTLSSLSCSTVLCPHTFQAYTLSSGFLFRPITSPLVLSLMSAACSLIRRRRVQVPVIFHRWRLTVMIVRNRYLLVPEVRDRLVPIISEGVLSMPPACSDPVVHRCHGKRSCPGMSAFRVRRGLSAPLVLNHRLADCHDGIILIGSRCDSHRRVWCMHILRRRKCCVREVRRCDRLLRDSRVCGQLDCRLMRFERRLVIV